VRFVTGLPREQQLARMRAAGEDPDELAPIDGYRLSLVDDGTRLHVGVRVPDGEAMESPALLAVLRRLAARYGVPPSTDAAGRRAAEAAHSLVMGTLARDGEWVELGPMPIPDEDGRLWPGFAGRSITPPGVTFAGQPLGDLQREMREGAAAVAARSGFAGFALHDYEHVRTLGSR
jgi:hypothetical protein